MVLAAGGRSGAPTTHKRGARCENTARRVGSRFSLVDDGSTAVQKAAFVVGAAFLLVGVAGFVPGITTDYDQMEFAGHDSGAQLLGIFQVSVLHNIVHLLLGVIGIAAARTWAASRWFLIGGGAVYLVLWLYGLLVEKDSDANFVPLDEADDWLHFGIGVGMIALGVLLGRRETWDVDRPDERT